MLHTMNLDPAPFAMMKSGKKTIELRLYDEKRRKIGVGDEILFTNSSDGSRIRARVLGTEVFADFGELYRSLPLLECGYTEETLPSASPKDMEAYYSREQQAKYGVVGIRLSLSEPLSE